MGTPSDEYGSEHPLTHVDALRHPLKMGDELVCLCCGHRAVHDRAHVAAVERYRENARWYSHEAASSWVKVPRYVQKLEAGIAAAQAEVESLKAEIESLKAAR